MSSRTFGLTAGGLLEAAGFFYLASLGDLAAQLDRAIPVLLLTASFYLISCHLVPLARRPLLVVGVFALLFRFTALWIAPTLTEDLYRYRWEGKLQAAGGNPYLARPSDPHWAGLRDKWYPQVASKDLRAGYGPLWEQVELWMYRLSPGSPKVFRLPAMLADVGVCLALVWVLGLYGLPQERVIWYAWCPLPVVEFWVSGHNDALLLLFLILAVGLARRQRWLWSFAFLSLAGLIKWWPFLLFPVFVLAGKDRPRWWQWLVVAPLSLPLFWLYRGPVAENVQFVTGFLGGWRNNDSLFALVLAVAGTPERAKWLAVVLIAVVAAGVALLRRELAASVLAVITAMLLLSANVHPWYLTWIVALLPLFPLAPLTLWTALTPLSYVVLIDYRASGLWNGSTPWRWWIYGPVLAVSLFLATPRKKK